MAVVVKVAIKKGSTIHVLVLCMHEPVFRHQTAAVPSTVMGSPLSAPY